MTTNPRRPGRPAQRRGRTAAAAGHDLCPRVEPGNGRRRRWPRNAEYLSHGGGGFKGPQTSVLAPGKYRINPKLFTVEIVPATTIEQAMVGVVKSNVGEPLPPAEADWPQAGDAGRHAGRRRENAAFGAIRFCPARDT